MYILSIPISHKPIEFGTEAAIVGWNPLKVKRAAKVLDLKKISVRIERQETCRKFFNIRRYKSYFASKHMCATLKESFQGPAPVISMT